MRSWFNFCGRGGRQGCLGRGEGKEPAVNDRKPQCIGRRHGAGQTLGKAPYTLCRYTSRQYSQALHNDGAPPREREGEREGPAELCEVHTACTGRREEGGGLLNSLLSPFLCVFLCEWVCHFSVWENSSHSLFLCVTQECPPWEEHEYSSTLKTWTQHQHTEKHCVLINS